MITRSQSTMIEDVSATRPFPFSCLCGMILAAIDEKANNDGKRIEGSVIRLDISYALCYTENV